MKTVRNPFNKLTSFSVKAIDKDTIKSRSFDTMRTSFAIEGIQFTDSQFDTLKSRGHLAK